MKNIALVQKQSNNEIRNNRLRLKERIKLNLAPHEKKQKFFDLHYSNQTGIQNKTQIHVKVLNIIGLVQKQFIQGQFQDAYDLKQKIGEGAHASVYKCIQKSTGKVYAVKITKQGDQQLIQSSKVQFKILKNLDHQNVMKAQAFYTDRLKMTTYLVCELCNYPQLGNYLRNRNTKFLQQSQATSIITSILQTLQYLHSNGICHRDIKPQNILYNPETKKIKVIDFDCAKNKKQTDIKFQMWTKTGSLHYQAPEYFQKTVYNEKVDIWAVGIIAYQLVTGNLPFKSHYYRRMVEMITQQDIQIDHLDVSEDFKYLLKKLLQRDSSKRFTASQCLRLPVILKGQQTHYAKILDDFNIELSSYYAGSPRSCTDVLRGRNKQMLTSARSGENKQILKYYCFVAQMQCCMFKLEQII